MNVPTYLLALHVHGPRLNGPVLGSTLIRLESKNLDSPITCVFKGYSPRSVFPNSGIHRRHLNWSIRPNPEGRIIIKPEGRIYDEIAKLFKKMEGQI